MGVLRHKLKRVWLFAAGAALCLQSLFPSGYMPADLSSGWVAMICPDGLPTEFVRSLQGDHHHHHHHHHHGSDTGQTASMADCQLGGAIDQPVVLAATVVLPVAGTGDAWRSTLRHVAVHPTVPSSYRSRAPPQLA